MRKWKQVIESVTQASCIRHHGAQRRQRLSAIVAVKSLGKQRRRESETLGSV